VVDRAERLVLARQHERSRARSAEEQYERGEDRRGERAIARHPLLELRERARLVGAHDAPLEECAQVLGELAHRRIARGDLARHGLLADRRELGLHGRIEAMERRRRSLEHSEQQSASRQPSRRYGG
jgi:hypothetical protein